MTNKEPKDLRVSYYENSIPVGKITGEMKEWFDYEINEANTIWPGDMKKINKWLLWSTYADSKYQLQYRHVGEGNSRRLWTTERRYKIIIRESEKYLSYDEFIQWMEFISKKGRPNIEQFKEFKYETN